MEHIKLFWSKLNIRKLLASCEDGHHWEELVFLYTHYDEYDNACLTMVKHPAVAFEHVKFKETIAKVTNSEVYYRAIAFYVEYAPTLLVDMLTVVLSGLDHVRVVLQMRKAGLLYLVKEYLLKVQSDNIKEVRRRDGRATSVCPACLRATPARRELTRRARRRRASARPPRAQVNDALYELYVEDEDHTALAKAIDLFGNFDQLEMAKRCEAHELLQFRRIAAKLYMINERYAQSVELSKGDQDWTTAIQTTADSGKQELAEELVAFFVQEKNKVRARAGRGGARRRARHGRPALRGPPRPSFIHRPRAPLRYGPARRRASPRRSTRATACCGRTWSWRWPGATASWTTPCPS